MPLKLNFPPKFSQTSTTPKPEAAKNPGRITALLTVAAILVGLFAVGVAQLRAPDSDFQNANLLSMVVGLLVVGFVLVQLHRILRSRGHRWLIPAMTGVVLLLVVGLFRWEGFSGEMVPQFRSRFSAGRTLQSQSVDISAATEDSLAPDAPMTTAAADSGGFLGPHRNGVIPDRLFRDPGQASEPKTLWNIGVGEGWSSFAVAGNRAVTMEQREQEEWLTCYRLADGELLWTNRHHGRHENPLGGIGPRSTPTIVGDRVYAQSATGFLWCVALSTGREYWTADLLELIGWDQAASEVVAPWGRAASPLVVDGMCIVPLGAPDSHADATRRSLIALDAVDGTERWRAGEDQLSYASPVLMTLAGRRQIVSVNEKTATGHDVETGHPLWSFRWPGQTNTGANCSSAVQVDHERFLLGKGYGGGSALVKIDSARIDSHGNIFTAEAVWASTRVLKTKFTHACVDDDVAYAISNGILQSVSIQEGEPIWSQPRSLRAESGQILLVEDVIVVQNEAGGLVFVQAGSREYEERYRIDALQSKTWNIPTIAGRHLLVRNDRQAICFLLPPRQSLTN